MGATGPAIRQDRPAILHLSRVGFVGGAERVTLTLAEALGREGFHSVLGCPEGGPLAAEARAAGLDVHPLAIARSQITTDPRRLWGYGAAFFAGREAVVDLCRASRVSLIHVHHPVGAVYGLRAARQLGIPLVLHVHDSLPARLLYALTMRRASKGADAIVACSAAGRDLVAACGGDGGAVEIVPNGLPPGFAAAAEATAPADLGPGPHVGVFAGLEPRKGQDVFLEAAAALLGTHPTARFWLVGGESQGADGAFAARLRSLASGAPLAGHVELTGFRDDVAALMRAMDVVVLPSLFHESLPMSLIEAMALGRPCVASRVGGTAEIVDDGRTGLLVPPGDARALRAAIETCLGPAGAGFGARAAEVARDRFSDERFGEAIAAIYRRLIPVGAAATRRTASR